MVMVIAGILLALTLGLYGRVKSKQIESRVLSEMAAIELALENYKAKNGVYPTSASWDAFDDYPINNWPLPSGRPSNRLYKQLCQTGSGAPPFLSDIKAELADGDALLSTAPGNVTQANLTMWNYNSYNPKYNKNSYDLWIEYGDYGEDGDPGTDDDFVKVISNWVN